MERHEFHVGGVCRNGVTRILEIEWQNHGTNAVSADFENVGARDCG